MNYNINYFMVFVFLLCLPQILTAQSRLDINIIGDPVVGEPFTIEIDATNQNGIAQLTLLLDGNSDTQVFQDCGGATNCTLRTELTQEYQGSKSIFADLRVASNGSFIRTSKVINVRCDREYCDLDPIMTDFFSWMREKKYPECITSKYLEFSKDPLLRNGGRFLGSMKTFLTKRPIFSDTIVEVDLIDVIPIDPEATYKSLSIGETDSCTYDNTWPELCPEPIPADYKYLEAHMSRTFGVKVVLNYRREEIDMANRFGGPSLNSGQYQFDFSRRRQFIRTFPTNSIVHWAVQSWNGRGVSDMTGASQVAEIDYEPSTSRGLYITTHEWGHTLGLRNNGSSVLPHPFQTRDEGAVYFQMDGIMSNTYKGRTHAIDPLDPLERYACDPPMGFIDEDTFVQEYYDGILGWRDELNYCGPVDVGLKSLDIISETSESLTLEIEVENTGDSTIQFGKINTGFVPIGLVNEQDELIELRTIEYLDLGTTVSMQWTVPGCNGSYSILIDPLNELEETDENNNQMGFECKVTSVESLKNEDEFMIYPNPVEDVITVSPKQSNKKYSIEIFNLDSKLLEMEDVNSDVSIDLSSYSAGVYLLRITSEKYVLARKVILR